jgi:hypothetical protein
MLRPVTGTAFAAALYAGTAAVAVWFVVRFPRAAPSSLPLRGAVTIGLSFAVQQIRIDASGTVGLYASVFGVAFPILVAAWISVLWLLQALRDLVHGRSV